MNVGLGRWLLGARGCGDRWVGPRLRFELFAPLGEVFACLEAVGLQSRFAEAVVVISLGLTVAAADTTRVLAESFVAVVGLLRDSWSVASGSVHSLLQHRWPGCFRCSEDVVRIVANSVARVFAC